MPACLPAATSSALSPPSRCAEPWGARWLSGLPTFCDPAGEGDTESTPGTNTQECWHPGHRGCVEPQGRAERGALSFLPHSHTLATGWEK